MTSSSILDAEVLIQRIAERIPLLIHPHVVVIGSIACAWAFRDVSQTAAVATKDIDILLRPSVDAVTNAMALGERLLDEGWRPMFPNDMAHGSEQTPTDELPALRLSPADGTGWFLELLAEPPEDQSDRKHWRRLVTVHGHFGLPSFRYMRVATHDAELTTFGLRVARPAQMALAHLLEHADPDKTEVRALGLPRYMKDVGRAVALWWLAQEQSVLAAENWAMAWRNALDDLYPAERNIRLINAKRGLMSVESSLVDAHALTARSVLAPHGTDVRAFERAYRSLLDLTASV